MTSSAIGKRINKVISAEIAPFLKSEGFRRKGRAFHRLHGQHVDVVSIQGSKWNSGSTGEFTVNVGVYYPAIAELYDPYRPDGLPEEYHCTLRERIGVLMTGNRDKWWKLGRFTNEEKLSHEVANAVRDFCIPWLAQMADPESVKANVPRFVAAVFAFADGDATEARQLLMDSLDEAPANADRTRVWAADHGIELV